MATKAEVSSDALLEERIEAARQKLLAANTRTEKMSAAESMRFFDRAQVIEADSEDGSRKRTAVTSPLPRYLAFEVSRPALLLYLYALAHADDSGICEGVVRYAAECGMGRDEWLAAIKELESAGHIKINATPVPIASFGRHRVIMGSRWDLVFLKFERPLRQVRLSAESWALLRSRVFERDDYTCRYCGARGGELECDHLEPISAGGTNELGNLVTACRNCNRSKRDKQLQQWRQCEST